MQNLTRRNRHPVDELADVRAEQKRLKEREDELRLLIINDECEKQGDEYEADITTSNVLRLDTTAVRKEFGDERLRKFLKPTEMTRIKLREIQESDVTFEGD